MKIKTERLKKLEAELKDLEQWLKLGLVPKNEIARHKNEIASIQTKIEEETARIQFLKESGDAEEAPMPRKSNTKGTYSEANNDTYKGMTKTNEMTLELETDALDNIDNITQEEIEENDEEEHGELEDPFSEKSRWRRGIRDNNSFDEWPED